jgi:hypothetical protein
MVAELPLSLRDFPLNEGDCGWGGFDFSVAVGFLLQKPKVKGSRF